MFSGREKGVNSGKNRGKVHARVFLGFTVVLVALTVPFLATAGSRGNPKSASLPSETLSSIEGSEAENPGSSISSADSSNELESASADSAETSEVSEPSSQSSNSSKPKLSNAISNGEYNKNKESYDGCYLAEDEAGKKLLYLEGDAYHRGLSEGYLCAEGVYRITHDFVDALLFEMIGLPISGADIPIIWPIVKGLITQASLSQEHAVPEEYRLEMRGIADGAKSRGYDVTYEEVLTVNVDFDFLLSAVYPVSCILCNEFAVFGEATDGPLYHGRDFMFGTGGDVFSGEALLIVQKPVEGYAFVASAAPGFVGTPTAMNEHGVSFAMDMAPSKLNRPLVSGMGALLLCRQVVEHADSMEEGLKTVQDTPRGVSWLYMIADAGEGKNPRAAVLETVADSMFPEGGDLLSTLTGLLPGLSELVSGMDAMLPGDTMEGLADILTGTGELVSGAVGLLPLVGDLHPDRGVAVRTTDYVDPEGLEDFRIVLPIQDLLVPTSEKTVLSPFPLQREDRPDLVTMTNHYILPQMNLTQMGLFYHTLVTLTGGGRESEWRYDTMLDLILQSLEDGGKIDSKTAMWLIDFLNPARCDYYGTDTTQSVKGHHVLMDNTNLQFWSLHGYYNQPWAYVNLKDFLN